MNKLVSILIGAVAFAVVAPPAAHASHPTYAALVADINPEGHARPAELTVVGDPTLLRKHDRVYFRATSPGYGEELWATDGTAAGTRLVRDIAPGPGSASPRYLVEVAQTLFFTARGPTGDELWRSDGTEGGTTLVKDILPGPDSSSPRNLTKVGSTVFFSADSDGDGGRELWRSDGTAAGTAPVPFPTAVPDPRWLTAAGDVLFFSATTPQFGAEVWRTDGTASGTVMTRDVNEAEGSDPRQLTVWNGQVFFIARDSYDDSWSLWRTDGTSSGTRNVIGAALHGPRAPEILLAGPDRLYFKAEGLDGIELWRTDGTTDGTAQVKDINPGDDGSDPRNLAVLGGVVLFCADDGVTGPELWRTTGTASGTWRVADLRPGPGGSCPVNNTVLGGEMFFSAFTDSLGYELWRTDATPEGTRLVQDIYRGTESSSPQDLVPLGGKLLFNARDLAHGEELRRTSPLTKTLQFSAPRRVRIGSRARLSAVLGPCPRFQGYPIRFQRRTAAGWRTVAIRIADAACRATYRPRIRKSSVFRAVAPPAPPDYLSAASNPWRIRVRR